jgi:bromodomain and WD repeat domain-containing protein 1/3
MELEKHSDRVDSIQWANRSLRFISGSKDGTAIIWHYKAQQWNTIQLFMTAKLPKLVVDYLL